MLKLSWNAVGVGGQANLSVDFCAALACHGSPKDQQSNVHSAGQEQTTATKRRVFKTRNLNRQLLQKWRPVAAPSERQINSTRVCILFSLPPFLQCKARTTCFVCSTWDYTLGGPPNQVRVTLWDIREYIRVLFYSYHTTSTGWGILLKLYLKALNPKHETLKSRP